MTRKHFIAIAEVLGRALTEVPSRCDTETFVFDHIVPKLTTEFVTFNPHFNETKFIERIEEVAYPHMYE